MLIIIWTTSKINNIDVFISRVEITIMIFILEQIKDKQKIYQIKQSMF